jgi:hypothetical protein
VNHSRTTALVAAAAVVAVAVLPLVAGPGPAAGAAPPPPGPVEFAPDDPAFFEPPNPIPAGEHGDLIRFQVVDTPFSDSYRIMYLSTTVGGAPTVVTGLVAAPEDRAPFGGYPVLLHGHGTIGLADQCAPSRGFEVDDNDYAREFDSVANATSDGWVVASTDYEGLGGPGVHPYLVGVSAGRSMLDAGRAARQVPGIYASPTTAIGGFSQGGHAGLWAAQMAPEWTPEQQLAGSVLAAPASDPGAFASMGAADPQSSARTVSIIAGLAAAYPEAAAAVGSVLTPAGQELATLMTQVCFDALPAGSPGPLVSADPATTEPFASLLAANTAGMVPSPAPMLIFQADGDLSVPLAMSDTLMARLCAGGQVVERRVIDNDFHEAVVGPAWMDGVDWLTGLVAGTTTPTSTCT